MNRQRKIVITVTYNDLGVIVDTKAEELDSSVQPNLQPTCNQLATDCISRQDALEAVRAMQTYKLFEDDDMILVDKAEVQTELMMMPSAQPEIIYCKDCRNFHVEQNGEMWCGISKGHGIDKDFFCADAERREE